MEICVYLTGLIIFKIHYIIEPICYFISLKMIMQSIHFFSLIYVYYIYNVFYITCLTNAAIKYKINKDVGIKKTVDMKFCLVILCPR